MPLPNDPTWLALADGAQFELDGRACALSVVSCGELAMPTGQLVVCDPFAMMRRTGNPAVTIPPGRYPVRVTLADVSEAGDGSHIREAYASLVLHEGQEVELHALPVTSEDGEEPVLAPGEFTGVSVDAGTICFVDGGALATGMPEDSWMDLFENGDEAWFDKMDDSGHIRAGLADIRLPLATDGANIILVHSGWGDGTYPLIGGYDALGQLLAVHIDFGVVPGPEESAGEG